MELINSRLFILVPTIAVIGQILRGCGAVPNKYIPLLLTVFTVLTVFCMLGASVDAFIQAILVVGVTVYGDQMIKQIKKEE